MSQTTSLLAGADQDILPETIPERADHVPPFARSLGTLLRLLGRPVSMPLLLSGILGGPSVNSPEACLRAARRWGLDGRIVHRKSLSDISSLVLPCILLLAGGRSCVLLSRDGGSGPARRGRTCQARALGRP